LYSRPEKGTKPEKAADASAPKASIARSCCRDTRPPPFTYAEFNELLRHAYLDEPALPEADADGNRPADAYAAVSQARGILRARRKLGLSQVDLARRAGIRPETLNRIEHGKHAPSVPTIAKIDKALSEAAKGR
jgi:DNA-binding XRE family transcriptional regulator